MPRAKEPEELTKVKLNLFKSDYEKLFELHPMQGPARVVRALVRAYVSKATRARDLVSTGDLEIELEDFEID